MVLVAGETYGHMCTMSLVPSSLGVEVAGGDFVRLVRYGSIHVRIRRMRWSDCAADAEDAHLLDRDGRSDNDRH